METIERLRETEPDTKTTMVMLMLLCGSLTSFIYFMLNSISFFLMTISFISFLALIIMFVFNKNLLHIILRPVAVILMKTFFSIEVEGEENIRDLDSVLLAGNHSGLLDSLIVSVACKRPVNFIMTNEIFSWPYAGKIVGFFNVIPVVPGKGMDALNKGIDKLKDGRVLAIFPEGRCTEDGTLGRFHRGVARMQTKSNATLVPFAIKGGFEAWPIAGLPKPHKIIIKIGAPVDCKGLKEKEITDNLKATVQQIKDELDNRDKNAENDQILKMLQMETTTVAAENGLSIKENNEWRKLNYNQLSLQARKLSDRMTENGINKGMRIAILSEPRPEWAIACLGGFRAGATVVPLDTKLSVAEIKSILSDCKPSMLFVSNKFASQVSDIRKSVSSISNVYCIEEQSKFENIESISALKGFNSYNHNARTRDETALIVYTSGTTGTAKGVMISFNNLISQLNEINGLFNINSSDSFVSILPLNHLFEFTCGFLGVINAGGNINYVSKLHPKEIKKALNDNKATYMIVVPLFLNTLKKGIEKEIKNASRLEQLLFNFSFKLSALTSSRALKRIMFYPVHKQFGGKMKGFLCGGAPLDKETNTFFDRIGLTVYQGYGLTETSPVIAVNTPENNTAGSVGRPLSSIEINIADNGEILVKGPGVMNGYYNREDLTAEVIDNDGWFHTGDIGQIDKNGYLYITGRIKNMIVLGGGKKVFPEEVEAVISKSNLINEICVIGMTVDSGNKKGTEQVYAIIVPSDNLIKKYKNNKKALEQMINTEVTNLSNNLASYKRPSKVIISYVEFVKTSTRKIKRNLVSEWVYSQVNFTRAA